MKLKKVELVYPQPDPHYGVFESIWYTRANGPEMIRFRAQEASDDVLGSITVDFSRDHGDTWGAPQAWSSGQKREGGVHREYWGFPVVARNRFVLVGAQAVLRSDHALDGMTQYAPYYRISDDGGRTWIVDEPMIQSRGDFDAKHPFANVWIGRNSVMPGNQSLELRDGRILVPCNMTLLGEDGKYFCPKGAWTYTAAAVLEGRWKPDGRLAWSLQEPVQLSPELSIRGAVEPTLAEMADGKLLMVIRADGGTSNPEAGWKWFSISNDGGKSWSAAAPWNYSDGTPFYSSSSISQFFRHSSGEWFWFGNISGHPPKGNNPRYPLFMGPLNTATLSMDRDAVEMIDTRKDGDSEALQLSNFTIYEDRRSGNIVMRMSRWDAANESGGPQPIKASVYAYTIEL